MRWPSAYCILNLMAFTYYSGRAAISPGEEGHGMPTEKWLWGLALLLATAPGYAEPIKLHPVNSHYYLFQGQPTILITSAEH
jgi:hypothetical protein